MIKLEIVEINTHQSVSREYENTRKGIHEIHGDIVTFAKRNNIPMDASDMLLDVADSLQEKDTVVKRISNFMFKLAKTSESKNFTKTKDVVNMIKKTNESKTEWHGRIYDDGCWWADIERHPYGQIRFWVGFEDKRNGNSKASIVTLAYLNNQGELRYCTDGIQIKQVVWNKIQSVAKALIKENLLEI